MLKLYKRRYYFAVNNENWVYFRYRRPILLPDNGPCFEKSTEKMSFQEAHRFADTEENHYYIAGDRTMLRKRPYIRLDCWPDYLIFKQSDFDTIRFKCVYDEDLDTSLAYILSNMPAELCIQYIKERGASVCIP